MTAVRSHVALTIAAALGMTACGGGADPGGGRATPTATATAAAPRAPDAPRLARLERRFRARVGVYAVDTGNGREVAHRAGERFPYASTFKALAAGAILRRSGRGGLEQAVPIARLDSAHSPITAQRVGASMTVRELCDAAVRYSDNTAANLLLDRLGGPRGLDAILERLGDDTTRMERREPELNDWAPGDARDTTTPRAIARDLRAFVLGDVLDPPDRRQLVRWLRTNTTGAGLIRAGVPDGWTVGDKTGTGATYGVRNDIAVVWPPGRAPIVVAVMTNRRDADAPPDDRLVAEAASAAVGALE